MVTHEELHSDVVKVLDALGASAQPVEQARVLPPEAYVSPDFFEFEKEAVFMHSWLCVGREQQIPETGDYLAVTIAGEPVIVTRDEEGIHAMSAVCRHRGHPLVENCQGNGRNFVCPYHRWTYNLSGDLVGAPHMDKVVPLAMLREESRLPRIRLETWKGFIFINFDDEAEPLAPSLAKFEPYFENYDLDSMVTIPPSFQEEPVPWNWKMLLENYIEPYHTEYVHPVIHDFAPSETVEFDPWRGDSDNVIVRYVPFLAPDGGLTDRGWAAPASFPVIDGLSKKQRHRVGFGMLPPTMNIIFTPDMLCYGLVYPVDATSLSVGGGLFTAGGWCLPKESAELPDFEERAARLMEGSRQLGAQDTDVNLAMLRGKYSRFAPRGRFSHLEETLSQFNRWLAVKYRAEAQRRGFGESPSALVARS